MIKMNEAAIKLIEQKQKFCEQMIEKDDGTDFYKQMVKENRIYQYILRMLNSIRGLEGNNE